MFFPIGRGFFLTCYEQHGAEEKMRVSFTDSWLSFPSSRIIAAKNWVNQLRERSCLKSATVAYSSHQLVQEFLTFNSNSGNSSLNVTQSAKRRYQNP